ncbi:MAG: Zinc finger CW-type PWWP domain 2 [Trebouxia sp. A1-2]|nr:MAG: Zinc finger CW-type PWWP domain 2 [Trebouxia sp. A1-2]
MAKGGKKAGSGASKSVSAAAVKVQEDVWAQCDNPNCQKWRRLPPGTVIDENTPWYCYMNPDEENAACEAPEESYRLDVELEPGYDEPRAQDCTSKHDILLARAKAGAMLNKGKSSSRSNQYSSQLWQGAPRTHSGGNSQGTKRRPDSDARLDSTYDSKRARLGTSAKSAEANGHSSPGKHEADAGTAPDLQGTSSGGLRHSLRPRRPPSYPLKEESPPPPGPSRQHQGSIRHGQGSSRPPSGQSQRAQAAAARPTQKARKQHKGFEKLLALGGLWEIVKGKGKAITPAPFWVWEGLATHTPAAAELAAQAADVASAARYFEGGNFPSGAAQAAESAALKRQAMTAAAVLGLDATSQIPDVIAAGPSKPTAAVAAASKPHQPASAVDNHAVPQMPSQSQAAASSQGQALLQMPSQMPAHGKPQSLSHILAQTQPQSQLQSQPHSQSQSQSQPQGGWNAVPEQYTKDSKMVVQASAQMYALRDLLAGGLALATGAPSAAGARAGAVLGPVTSMWASPRPYPVGASAGARYEFPEAPNTTAWLCPKTELVAFTVVFTVAAAAACTAEDTAC